jgi:hypothetical protein
MLNQNLCQGLQPRRERLLRDCAQPLFPLDLLRPGTTRTIEQMRLINALCRFVEIADSQDSTGMSQDMAARQ